jgi:hypothetical protein
MTWKWINYHPQAFAALFVGIEIPGPQSAVHQAQNENLFSGFIHIGWADILK